MQTLGFYHSKLHISKTNEAAKKCAAFVCAFITDINCSHRIICIAFGSSEQSERASENGRKTHSQPELIAVVQQIVSKLWHPLKWHERIFYYVTPIAGVGCSVCVEWRKYHNHLYALPTRINTHVYYICCCIPQMACAVALEIKSVAPLDLLLQPRKGSCIQ